MNNEPVEILLVEDNPNDVRLTLDALQHHKLANHIHVARDGEEALDFLFGRGQFVERSSAELCARRGIRQYARLYWTLRECAAGGPAGAPDDQGYRYTALLMRARPARGRVL